MLKEGIMPIKKLERAGYKILGPIIGDMACGEYGAGKFSDPNEKSLVELYGLK